MSECVGAESFCQGLHERMSDLASSRKGVIWGMFGNALRCFKFSIREY